MNAVLVVSHGSRSPKTKKEIAFLVSLLRQQLPGALVEFAFLEIESPSIPEGIDWCAKQGATSIMIALNFLNSGRHVDDDIPSIVKEAQKKYPNIKFSISKPIGQHPQIPDLFLDIINDI